MENSINNEKILDVKDLRISFKTDNGTVKAVRGISFSLYRGKTLAIVGESGSGKSVTSRAILGILANNKLVEGGQIIYDGKDLLTLSEDRFTRIRGSKISMIFQDPLSSLNPIMKVGKQLTEPMFLKAKFAKREARKIIAGFDKEFSKFYVENPELKELLEKYKANETASYSCFAANQKLKLAFDKAVLEIKKYNEKQERLEATAHSKGKKFTPEFKKNIEFDHSAEQVFENSFSAEEMNKLSSNIEKVISKYKDSSNEKLKILLGRINEVLESYFSSFEKFDFKSISNFAAELKYLVKESRFSFETDRDDIVEVLPVSISNYLDEFVEVSKYKLKQESLKAKAEKSGKDQSKSAKSRAKARESVSTPEQIVEIIKGTILYAKEHIEELVNEDFDVQKYTKEFISYYKELIFKKLNRVSKEEAKTRAIKLLAEVGIPEAARRYNQYPFEFSGGMRQRIVIAIALSSNPEILICDEPTTALDVTIQAQILELINKIKDEKNLSIIFITHDLGVVANMADDIAVMYAGKIVEYGTVYDIFYDPRHPYTWALLGSMPDLDTKEKLCAIPGTPPNMILPPKGDAFAARNAYAMEIDFEEEPPLFKVSETHYAATWLLHPSAPHVEMPSVVKERIERTKGDMKYGK